MLSISRNPLAVRDLLEIWGYIAEDSEERADSFIDQIEVLFTTIAKNPKIGRMREELASNVRSLPLGRYVIFYLQASNRIEIVRVLHSARDVDADFFPNT